MNSIYIQTLAPVTKEPQVVGPNETPDWANPFVGRVVAVYIHRSNGRPIALLPSEAAGVNLPQADVSVLGSEAELLTKTWAVLKDLERVQKEQLVTFNGRKHTVPFLYIRSFVNKVAIGSSELLRDRYKALSEHLDLMEAFTFHHITARPSLTQLMDLMKMSKPMMTEGKDLQGMLQMAVDMKSPAVWIVPATSGLQYAEAIHMLATAWDKSLRPVY